jgi:hypothetical protein
MLAALLRSGDGASDAGCTTGSEAGSSDVCDDKGENDRSLITPDNKPDRLTRHRLSDQVPANTPQERSLQSLS